MSQVGSGMNAYEATSTQRSVFLLGQTEQSKRDVALEPIREEVLIKMEGVAKPLVMFSSRIL